MTLKSLQLRRGTEVDHALFIGEEGEITYNSTNDSIHAHDGVTSGGFETARIDLNNVSDLVFYNKSVASGTIGFIQVGADAVFRGLSAKAGDTISVKDYGAIGDGVADDGLAIQYAINAAFALSTATAIPTKVEVVGNYGVYLTSIPIVYPSAWPGSSWAKTPTTPKRAASRASPILTACERAQKSFTGC